jgi:hypothetical protein
LRGNCFSPATTDAGQPASSLQRRVQHHSALQRRLHLRDPHWNHRWVRQGPRASQKAGKVIWKRMPRRPVLFCSKGDQPMGRKIKATLFAALVITVLCAGTVSARQLQRQAGVIGVCSGRCSATQPCSGACSCVHINGASLGSCVSDPP